MTRLKTYLQRVSRRCIVLNLGDVCRLAGASLALGLAAGVALTTIGAR